LLLASFILFLEIGKATEKPLAAVNPTWLLLTMQCKKDVMRYKLIVPNSRSVVQEQICGRVHFLAS
jgi:hypothetical protein